jgi:hypothetical protein
MSEETRKGSIPGAQIDPAIWDILRKLEAARSGDE